MHPFQVLHLLILISLAATIIEAQFKPRCSTDCGGTFFIRYPFGIGRNCSASEWYTIDCKSTKAYLPALSNLEVLDISEETVTVNVSVIKVDCKNPVLDSNLVVGASYGRSPFRISGSNSLVVKGCGNGVLMQNGTIVGGCSSTCGNSNDHDRNNCVGVGCCQTTIPHDLKSFTLNLSGLESHDGDGTCGSAFLVDMTSLGRASLAKVFGEDYSFAPISLSWNERFDLNLTILCNETCGEVSIQYPFGIERNCSESDWFNVDCNSSTPYLPAFNNVEVLDFNSIRGTVTVNAPMISDCENSVQNNSLLLNKSPFRFSGLDNIFVVEGCGTAAIMEHETIVSGCSATCGNNTVSDLNNCFGIGCCQTTMPAYRRLESFYVNLTGLERQAGNGSCGSAFMVDRNLFVKGRFSRQFVPITLGWREIPESESTECRLCELKGGYCTSYQNDGGTFTFYCGYHKTSKYSTGVILGISISMGLLFLTVISYALYKIIKKTKVKIRKQRCFKRNGGGLFKQQEATGLVDKTILFTSNELEKATDHFSENRVLGRGGQGTVYKGMLADGRIVAIKKEKLPEIDTFHPSLAHFTQKKDFFQKYPSIPQSTFCGKRLAGCGAAGHKTGG